MEGKNHFRIVSWDLPAGDKAEGEADDSEGVGETHVVARSSSVQRILVLEGRDCDQLILLDAGATPYTRSSGSWARRGTGRQGAASKIVLSAGNKVVKCGS